jgi:hypothetical protein
VALHQEHDITKGGFPTKPEDANMAVRITANERQLLQFARFRSSDMPPSKGEQQSPGELCAFRKGVNSALIIALSVDF